MLKIISNIKRTPILLSIGLVLGMGVVSRCQITSAVNGDYSVGATWVGGSSPDALLDNVLILHDVTMDSDITIEQNFQIQGSLIGTAGNDITVSGIGTLEAGLIDINGNISLSNDGSMTIYSGDTVTVNDFWMQNNSVLTVEAGAVLIVNGDFTGKNNGIVTLDGEICVSGATKITNNFMVIGSGYFKTGSSTTIKNGATIFGSSTECTDCIYSSGCTSGAISEWDGSSGTDWFTAANWSNGVPNDQTPARIPSTASAMPVINAAGAECFHLMVLPGASVEIAASNSLDVYGDLVMRGSFIPNQSTVNMVGTCASGRLNSGGNTNLHSLLVNNINDVAITAGTWGITGSLDVVLGSFDTNDSLTIISNSLGTGRIGEILGVGITGEISMERYIDAGETNWRYFSSAVTGATLAQYNDDFVTAGYPGSWYPAFGWESIYTYDETMGVGFGYLPATSSAQVIGVGQGLQVWCGDTITGTLPFTVDLRGVPNQGPILMPVSYTFTGTPGEDGFCHIGNPYASTIDWDAIGWVKVNVAEATYIVDPDTEMYATYIAGAGTNGGSRYIASQQAFWVEATAVAPVLSITESCKSGTDATFFKSGESTNPGTNIHLEGFGMSDECVIRNQEGTVDARESNWDGRKLWGAWGVNPQISLINGELEDLSIHTFDFDNQEWVVPMRVIVFQDGDYTLDFSNFGALEIPCARLEDTYDGSMYDIDEGSSFTFTMFDTTWAPRFKLHLGKAMEITSTGVSCSGMEDGSLEINLGESGDVNYTITSGSSSSIGTADGNPLIINALASDVYTVVVDGLVNICNTTSFTDIVSAPPLLKAFASVQNAIEGGDGIIEVEAVGGTPPYSYFWNTGGSTSTIIGLSPGDYTVEIYDQNECYWTGTYFVGYSLGLDQSMSDAKFLYYSDQNYISLSNWNFSSEEVLGLYSMDGRLIKQYLISEGLTEYRFDVPASIASGPYVLIGLNQSFKFVK